MNNKRTSQRLIISIIFLLLILFTFVYIIGKNKDAENNEEPDITDKIAENDFNSNDHVNSNRSELIRSIFLLANDGKSPNVPFISGTTKWQDVSEKWGKSDYTSETVKGKYEQYESQNITIGHNNNIVTDIRSYDPKLQQVTLQEIKNIGGEPDEIRYYKDEFHDQMILVYKITASAELLWVLPKISAEEANPHVDHTSLYVKANENQPVSEVVDELSLEEKIGQLIFAGISETTLDAKTNSLLNEYKVGGIIFYEDNFVTTKQAVKLINQIKTNNNSQIPLFLGVDQEGGNVTRLPGGFVSFPDNEQIGKINNKEFSFQIGSILGNELKEFGLNVNFAPSLDINSNPNNPVIGDRSFGSNANLVSDLGIATMKGIQSRGIIPAIKHFPGYGDTITDSHLELPIVNKSLDELMELELVPFEQAINQGADVVMTAHILLTKLDKNSPASMSEVIMTDILRKRLGFTGVIITDDMTMGAITEHYEIGNAAVESVKSGSDIILVGHEYSNVIEVISSLKQAIEGGEISQQRLDESVERIIKLKRKYNVNDDVINDVHIGNINKMITNLLTEYLH